MRYSAYEMEKIRQQAKDNNLDAPAGFWRSTAKELCFICNGCGAEDAPQKVRDLLSWIYRYYTPAHCIHDYEFEESDGSEELLEEVNLRFRDNCLLIWQKKYGKLRWINPVAWWGWNKIRLAYKALKLGSKSAWDAAYQRRIAREAAL